MTPPGALPRAVQTSLDDLGTPLHEVTFLVVDLETTGASPATSSITEIGAVRVRGGEVLAELSTLVRPAQPIPREIAVLTGITDAMVAGAPPVAAVLPSLLELVRGSVVVAHNARFDVSFLVAACAGAGLTWPSVRVLDTLALARQVLPRTEVANHKLSTLAAHLRSTTAPTHRALDDARATVDVLHALLARVGSLGVTSLEEVLAHSSRVPEPVRRKRHLAAEVPSAPGAYLFCDEHGEVLYVGSSVDLRSRVRSYFTASETRSRMAEMVRLAAKVVPVVTETVLEARVRELRLIAEHDPRYNRRSRRPLAVPWLKLTVEPFPRLSVVRERRADTGDGAAYLGPFRRAADAEAAAAALTTALPLRQCTRRLPVRPTPAAAACALADMGRCG
ncbi:MAG: DNA polymerase III epsilon subunit-related protein MSMEG4261, partial [uncultured Quadrisphaera sp.]